MYVKCKKKLKYLILLQIRFSSIYSACIRIDENSTTLLYITLAASESIQCRCDLLCSIRSSNYWLTRRLETTSNNLNDYIQIKMLSIFVLNFSILLQPRPTKGKMRIHCLENVDKALQFLREQRVHLENMGSHDIVDGNPRLSLGLIWTIILRFQVINTINNTVEHTSVSVVTKLV